MNVRTAVTGLHPQTRRSVFSYLHAAGPVDFGRTDAVTQRGRSTSLLSFQAGKSLLLSTPAKQK